MPLLLAGKEEDGVLDVYIRFSFYLFFKFLIQKGQIIRVSGLDMFFNLTEMKPKPNNFYGTELVLYEK